MSYHPDQYLSPQQLMDVPPTPISPSYSYQSGTKDFSPQQLMDAFSTDYHSIQYQYGTAELSHLMNVPPISSNYHPNQYSDCVSPQHLMNMPQEQTSHTSASNSHRNPIQDVGYLAPGTKHQLSYNPLPTAQSILDGSYSAALANQTKEIVLYLPRLSAYAGSPSLKPIVFSVNGTPGPYLKDLLKARVTLDDGTDAIFKAQGWKRTVLLVDWPGITADEEKIPCFVNQTRPVTRSEMAQTVANSVATIMSRGKSKNGEQLINSHTRAWDLRNIHFRDVRLMAINYYRKLWIPVLAVDVD